MTLKCCAYCSAKVGFISLRLGYYKEMNRRIQTRVQNYRVHRQSEVSFETDHPEKSKLSKGNGYEMFNSNTHEYINTMVCMATALVSFKYFFKLF